MAIKKTYIVSVKTSIDIEAIDKEVAEKQTIMWLNDNGFNMAFTKVEAKEK